MKKCLFLLLGLFATNLFPTIPSVESISSQESDDISYISSQSSSACPNDQKTKYQNFKKLGALKNYSFEFALCLEAEPTLSSNAAIVNHSPSVDFDY